MERFPEVNLIQGPGQHAQVLLQALLRVYNTVDSFGYWPTFAQTSYSNGEVTKTSRSSKLDLVSGWVWRLHNHAPFMFQRPWHLDVYYHQYEKWIGKHIQLPDHSLLWAWSQMSLDVMRNYKRTHGGKIFLEYPMIHPVVWNNTIKTESEKFYPPSLFRNYYSFFTEGMVRKMQEEISIADKIILLSDFAVESFKQQQVPEEKLVKISLPISYAVKPRTYSHKDKVVFLYAGRIELWKGVQYLVQAFKELKLKNAELWLAGSVLPEMKEYMRKASQPNIKILGFQPKEKLAELYQQADVFVFPTLQDSFGMVILEAMSYGLPVISSVHSAAPEIIQNNREGFLYTPYHVEDLKMHMLQFMENRSLIGQMGKKAQETVAQKYTSEHYLSQINQLLAGV